LFLRYFQPLPPPDPLHAIFADEPTSLSQQCSDPAIAEATVLARQGDCRGVSASSSTRRKGV
jgi:hypothetical protein